jgi:hypothetical protein
LHGPSGDARIKLLLGKLISSEIGNCNAKRAGTVGVRVVLIRYQTPLLLIVALAVITICGSLSGVQEFRLTLSEMLIQVAVVVGIYLFIGNSGVTSFGHIGFMCVGFEAREPHRRRPHPASSMEAGKNAV